MMNQRTNYGNGDASDARGDFHQAVADALAER
jgi:hypothetical protein